ncbi:hypothetical protein E2562_015350 [Oryza meyeriana var. granulata]|uniref:Uncharacterized protein n=1 Tax=Oryza meyeriana var. granulata TaxID=110450 RepID=A0A6G1EJX4_9ORYZ|nr:hypothetical protein E2562_015350 [Oryza meyeriana var. granulata]
MVKSVAATASEGDGGHGDGLAEYGCVTYLALQGYPNAYTSLFGEMDEFFNVGHLQQLVMEAKWDDAIRYLLRFLPHHPDPMSVRAKVLYLFVQMHGVFAKIVAGKRDADTQRLAKMCGYYRRLQYLSHGELKLRSIIHSILHCDTLRTSLDWGKVRKDAADIVSWLANITPELQRHILSNKRTLMMPHNVLPIGSSFRQRRCPVKKLRGRQPSKFALADAFEYIKMTRLLFPSNSEGPSVGHSTTATELLANELDESLASGRHWEYYPEILGYPLEWPSEKSDKGDTRDPVSLALFGTSTPPKNFSTSSLTNAGHSTN